MNRLSSFLIVFTFAAFPFLIYSLLKTQLIRSSEFSSTKFKQISQDSLDTSHVYLGTSANAKSILFKKHEQLLIYKTDLGLHQVEAGLKNITTAAISASGDQLAIITGTGPNSILNMLLLGVGVLPEKIELKGNNWSLDYAPNSNKLVVYSSSDDSYFSTNGRKSYVLIASVSSGQTLELNPLPNKPPNIAATISGNILTSVATQDEQNQLRVDKLNSVRVPYDINNDGKSDIIGLFPGFDGAHWWAYELAGSDTSRSKFSLPTGDYRIWKVDDEGGTPFTGDFNADGWLDFALFTSKRDPDRIDFNSNWQIYLSEANNSGNYRFSNKKLKTGRWGDSLATALVADVNLDGSTDIISHNKQSNWSVLLTGNEINFAKATLEHRGFGASGICGQPGSLPIVGIFGGESSLLSYKPVGDTIHWTACIYDEKKHQVRELFSFEFGQASDRPLLGDVNCDGNSELIFYRPKDGTWVGSSWEFLKEQEDKKNGIYETTINWSVEGAHPFLADFDGDGCDDLAFYDPQKNRYRYQILNSKFIDRGNYLFRDGSFAISKYFLNGPSIPHIALYQKTHRRGMSSQRVWGYLGQKMR